MKVDRTYRTNPEKFRADLKQEILNDVAEEWRKWENNFNRAQRAISEKYQTIPGKHQADVEQKIVDRAAAQWRKWESKGRLPVWIRVKYWLTRIKIQLNG